MIVVVICFVFLLLLLSCAAAARLGRRNAAKANAEYARLEREEEKLRQDFERFRVKAAEGLSPYERTLMTRPIALDMLRVPLYLPLVLDERDEETHL